MIARHRRRRHARRVQHTKTMKTRITARAWDEIVRRSKTRKQSIKSLAEAAGYTLVKGAEPRERKSWRVAS